MTLRPIPLLLLILSLMIMLCIQPCLCSGSEDLAKKVDANGADVNVADSQIDDMTSNDTTGNSNSNDSTSTDEPIWETSTVLSPAYCREIVSQFSNLTSGLEFPEHFEEENPVKTSSDFNVSEYFTVLDRLSMEPGYVLDYVYYFGGIGGEPVLYARKADQAPYRDYAEYSKDNPSGTPLDEDDYLNHVQTDGTPEGFFQLYVLQTLAGQFYLFWHANYDDYRIICESSELSPSLAIDADSGDLAFNEAIREASLQNFTPVVEMNDDEVRVNAVVFTSWGGFLRKSLTAKREFPHEIVDENTEVLVPYDCGILF